MDLLNVFAQVPVPVDTGRISDTVWLAVILCFQTILLAFIQYKTKQVVDTTHGLVDGAMSAQLEINRTLARKLANDDPTPENLAIAKKAEEAYQQHLKNKEGGNL